MEQRSWTTKPSESTELDTPGSARVALASALALTVLVGSAVLLGQDGRFSSPADRLAHSACSHYDQAQQAASTGDETISRREIRLAAGDATFGSSDALAASLDSLRSSQVSAASVGAVPEQANMSVVDDVCADFTGPLWWLTSP